MIKNLIFRWCVVCAVLYYCTIKILPTFKLYTNQYTLQDNESLMKKVESILTEEIGNDTLIKVLSDTSNLSALVSIENEFNIIIPDSIAQRTFNSEQIVEIIINNYQSIKKDALKLGMDLQGGALLVYEIHAIDYFLSIADVKNFLDLKSEISSISNNQTTFDEILEFCNENSIELKSFFKTFSSDLELKSYDNSTIIDAIKQEAQNARNTNITTIHKRMTMGSLGLDDFEIIAQGDYRVRIKAPGLDLEELKELEKLIETDADFEMSLVVEDSELLKKLFKEIEIANVKDGLITNQLHFENGRYYLPSSSIHSIQSIIESDTSQKILFLKHYNIAWGKEVTDASTEFVEIYLLQYQKRPDSDIYFPPVGSGDIIKAKHGIGPPETPEYNQPIVTLELNDEAKIRFGSFTGQHRGRRLAIVLNNIVYMAPGISKRIDGGQILITGCENQTEARDIAAILEAGSFSAGMYSVNNSFIGASLGKDSIEKGSKSMSISLIIVLLFMIIYYLIRNTGSRIAGFIACIALLFNLVLICAVLADLGATLTFPGIAGLLLIIGMSVDANVIIFERIKEEIEEVKARNSLVHAINVGYNKAFVSILDANITTIIVAILLFAVGKDDIQGFGITLVIGILGSMFTGVFVTKTIFLTYASIFKKNKMQLKHVK